jgi:hypothetical protein
MHKLKERKKERKKELKRKNKFERKKEFLWKFDAPNKKKGEKKEYLGIIKYHWRDQILN